MVTLLISLFRSVRPRQSLKNLALLAPLIFSGNFFYWPKLSLSLAGALSFSFLTSAVYLFNDIIDLPYDRVHPYKKKRPIASGELPVTTAFFAAVVLIFLALYSAISLNFFFFLICLIYLTTQVFYTLWLKKIVILDVITVAVGFVLRVYAGTFIVDVHTSVWFLLCVIALSLFLAVGKRRAEMSVLEKSKENHRQVLSNYSPVLLDNYLAMFSTSAWLAYALFTFFEPAPPIFHKFPFLTGLVAKFPISITGTNKWLMVTIPVVIYGIMRYTKIIYEGEKAEAPERVLLSDKPLLSAVTVWGILLILIIYGLG